MKEKTFLTLKPGTELIETESRVGIRLGDKLRYAENAGQAALLRALAHGPQPLDAVSALLRAQYDVLPEDAATALETMKFVLDFGDYYDTGGTDPPKKDRG
ncbi:MAG: hypothetical protein LKJ86_05805 [Oscillibacter sp.]|nr:hypothetical protein [Oscillibacter sp.]